MHTHPIEDAESVTGRSPKARKRAFSAIVAAAVVMVTMFVGAGAASAANITIPQALNSDTCTSGDGNCPAANPNPNVQPTATTATDNTASIVLTFGPLGNALNVAGFRIESTDLSQPSALFNVNPHSQTVALGDAALKLAGGVYTYEVTGLKGGDSYVFRVYSVNTAGQRNTSLDSTILYSDPVPAGTHVGPPPTVVGPAVYATVDEAVKQDYEDFLGRQPSFSELKLWEAYFVAHPNGCSYLPGDVTAEQFARLCPNEGAEYDLISFLRYGGSTNDGQIVDPNQIEPANTFNGDADPVIRLYYAFFQRIPDYTGLKTWINKERAGTGIDQIATAFAKSSEFTRTYGSLSDADFVTLVYFNVLGRTPDFGGQNFWLTQLASGKSRGAVMDNFAQSTENTRNKSIQTSVIGSYVAMLYRAPSQAELTQGAADITHDANGFMNGYFEYQGIVRNSIEYGKTARQATPWNPIKASTAAGPINPGSTIN